MLKGYLNIKIDECLFARTEPWSFELPSSDKNGAIDAIEHSECINKCIGVSDVYISLIIKQIFK